MKNIIIIFVATFLTVTLFSQTDKFTVKVEGMGCAFCANGVDRKLSEWEDISALKINLNTGMVSFEYPAEKNLDADKINNQINDAGYTTAYVHVERASGETEKKQFSNSKKSHTDFDTPNTLIVKGNCNMCKERIETAANSVKGVSKAIYNIENQTLSFKMNTKKTSKEELEKVLIRVGHDTENFKADDAVYDNLHSCCKYKRD